jgi:Toprim-like
VELNQEFLIELFYTHCKRPIHKKYQNSFNAECPICKEGKSAGRSRRLFYFPTKDYFYCHNCCKSWRPMDWAKEVTGLTFPEIVKRNKEKSGQTFKSVEFEGIKTPVVLPDLPENSIDLTDQTQVKYYFDDDYVILAEKCIRDRRLITAVNSCKKFYISLEDKVHRNRLIIPFFGDNNKVVCYQSRALSDKDHPRYLTKFGEKDIFNINNVDSEIPYVFIFEGPIDSMFVRNGVAIASLNPTEKQESTLNSLIGYEKIYVFDNDKNNEQTAKRIEKHIKQNKKIFIWPKEFKDFKDFNEICCKLKLDEIPWKFVVKHSAEGAEALIKQKLLKS